VTWKSRQIRDISNQLRQAANKIGELSEAKVNLRANQQAVKEECKKPQSQSARSNRFIFALRACLESGPLAF